MKNYVLILFLISLKYSLIIAQSENYSINTEKSNINWFGEQITGKKHFGLLKFKKGVLVLSGTGRNSNKVIAGNFTVDMTSLTVEDLTGSSKERLQGHLKSDDFFSTEKFKDAFLEITNSGEISNGVQKLSGDLIIKGLKHPVSFTFKLEDEIIISNLSFDRTKYDIRFRSGTFFENIGDKLIYDEIKLEVVLILE
jgi:polyisoprenoid-binding protein YceI